MPARTRLVALLPDHPAAEADREQPFTLLYRLSHGSPEENSSRQVDVVDII